MLLFRSFCSLMLAHVEGEEQTLKPMERKEPRTGLLLSQRGGESQIQVMCPPLGIGIRRQPSCSRRASD